MKTEHYKISKLSNDLTVSKFVTKKFIEVNDWSSGQYSLNENVRFNTPMLRSDLCDYSDVPIVVKGRISVTATNNANRRNKKLTFKKNAPFSSCTPKINDTFIDNAEDLSIVISVYNLLEYITLGSLWNCYKDEVNDDANENNDAGNYWINNSNTTSSKSFEYKTKIIGSTPNNNSRLDGEVVVPLKYLSNFCRSFDLPLINCEMILICHGRKIV